ncbi:glutaminyl-peptide cyclotransferase [Streptomyces sp. ISL-44]|uniref:glutaminyl-peptide cyclotransferase n=1 Tax=Streptomyces sp. ISL-44 TaxID=2819184 RepID=UPI001BE778BB|nr:glutaminyl-peptide cyclotransferase [Streptomyces sp. ISL-44]MBT2545494.1 glutaminyl-peptide cyclotransferase [Streptomyces sp. ISL-44]
MRGLVLVPLAACFFLGSLPGMASDGGELRKTSSGGLAPERLRVEVLEALAHDPGAFTQGLEMYAGRLYESTGMLGQSSVRVGLPGQTPAVRAQLEDSLFGEGVTVIGRTMWQLTWQNRVAIKRDSQTLAELRRLPYAGEGWGICYQRHRRRVVTSDGSAELTYRDPENLREISRISVTDDGRPMTHLNELECVDDTVYANVWGTDKIAKIDTTTGKVAAVVDAEGIRNTDTRAGVLNGIAAIPGTDQFLITGKYWPTMFKVRFVRPVDQ